MADKNQVKSFQSLNAYLPGLRIDGWKLIDTVGQRLHGMIR